jgi:hypothetical protein
MINKHNLIRESYQILSFTLIILVKYNREIVELNRNKIAIFKSNQIVFRQMRNNLIHQRELLYIV